MSVATDPSVSSEPPTSVYPADDRPITSLSMASLFRLSVYWLGLVAVFGGVRVILQERSKVPIEDESVRFTTIGIVQALGVAIAVIIQPTIGSISDYTV